MSTARSFARPNHKVRFDERLLALQTEVSRERTLRLAAERNARNFHALLIAERIRRLPTQTNGSGHAHSDGAREAGAQEVNAR